MTKVKPFLLLALLICASYIALASDDTQTDAPCPNQSCAARRKANPQITPAQLETDELSNPVTEPTDSSVDCRLCGALIESVAEKNSPKAFEVATDLKKHNRVDRGKIEYIVESALESGCQFTKIHGDRLLRRKCDTYLSTHTDTFSLWLTKFYTTEDPSVHLDYDTPSSASGNVRGDSGSSSMSILPNVRVRDETIKELVKHLCINTSKSCKGLPSNLRQITKKKKYFSQREPSPMYPPLVNDGRVHPVTTSTIQPILLGEDPLNRADPMTLSKDVIIYYAFPSGPCPPDAYYDDDPNPSPGVECSKPMASDNGAIHKAIYPTYKAFASLYKGSTIFVTTWVNTRANSLHPPFDFQMEPSILLHPNGNRLIPAQLRSLTEDLSIYDLMSYLVEAGSPFVKRLTHEIMVILTENKLEKYIGIHQSEEFYQSDTFKKIQEVASKAVLKIEEEVKQARMSPPAKQEL